MIRAFKDNTFSDSVKSSSFPIAISGARMTYGDDIFEANDQVLLCKVCDKEVSANKTSQIILHLKTALHTEKLKTFKLKGVQLFLNETKLYHIKNHFNKKLTKAMISADIPFWKFQNSCFLNFLKRWTGQNVASESLLRKVHLRECFNKKINYTVMVKKKLTPP